MINQLTQPYIYTAQETACIHAANNNWNSKKKCIKELKANLNIHFNTHQKEKCCYCGLQYDRTGRGEIEHIAPKGENLYPHFSFTPLNLAKACQLCNSSSMKHTYDTIATPNAIYNQCEFKIVHPYLDVHSEHYEWKYGLLNVVISIKNNSEKAKESIRIFELASEKRTRARAIQRNQERLERLYNLPIELKSRIKAVITFK